MDTGPFANVGGCLNHVTVHFESASDFLALAEYRLLPVRIRSLAVGSLQVGFSIGRFLMLVWALVWETQIFHHWRFNHQFLGGLDEKQNKIQRKRRFRIRDARV